MDDNISYNLEVSYKGVITPSGIPLLKINIIGLNIKLPDYMDGIEAVLDTGAVKTHITPKFAKLLNLKPSSVDVGLYPLKEGISETNVYPINFIINGIEALFSEEFKEMPYEFPYPIIFGTEFLMRCKSLNINFIDKTYVLDI